MTHGVGVSGGWSERASAWQRISCSVLSVTLGLAACGGEDKGGQALDIGATDATSLGDTAVVFDTNIIPDTGGDDVPLDIVPGGFGAACQGNTECDSGWCVEGPDGYVCTTECLETCPNGFDCRSVTNVKGDIVFLCLPRVRKLCAPCLEDFQCNGGGCLQIDGEGMCATGCETAEDCPRGYGCTADASGAHTGTFCQPLSGSCSCSPTYEGVARACERTNARGTCLGSETCDPETGWVGCTARDASDESCNYLDDDCDGDVDEDFQTDGIYASEEACGSCTTKCDEVLPNTVETRCAVAGGVARCEVVECAPGFTLLNPYVCAPDAGSTCQPCESSASCVGDGAACVTLSDGKFCTTACGDGSACGDGFSCQTVPESATKQCVPTSGSCTCDGSNTDLSRACAVTYTPPDPDQPSVTCKGLEQCTTAGWGGCVLPTETCDGIDNDCDGVVDQPFKTGDKYSAVEHCGACEVSCTALSGPNAAPACDLSGAVPTCGYTCVGQAVDVNGIAEDGCECTPIAGPDLAGDSLDTNCDGIDGEVANGIFVSKSGAETNPGTRELPVLKLATGISKAKSGGKRDVYVATGVYSENVVLADGVGVFGGYAPFFDEHDTTLYETAVVGQAPDGAHPGTVSAIGLGTTAGAAETVFDGFTVFGINAANLEAQNSYAIYLRDSGTGLRISKNRIIAGPGGNGRAGLRGTDGLAGVTGTTGGAAKNLNVNCNTSTGGGGGGTRTCGAVNVSGGTGGNALCPLWSVEPLPDQSGAAGNGQGAGAGGAAGWDLYIDAGPFGACGQCLLPPDLNRFTGADGAPGSGGTGGSAGTGCPAGAGTVAGGHWVGGAGGGGGTGANGGGGGGGGAGGGVEVDGNSCSTTGNDDLGGSGGGGGSGGCGATGGSGGVAGGGSFGIFVVGSGANLPKIAGNTIQGGRGGAGGNGGPAGVGGNGGSGGGGGASGDTFGQDNVTCAQGGGSGGEGGDAGHGGGGGGGCGGGSYGIYAAVPAPPAVWKSGNTFASGAAGGVGGKGGASVDQARNGADGASGQAADTNF